MDHGLHVVERLITSLSLLSSGSPATPNLPQRASGWGLGVLGLGSRTWSSASLLHISAQPLHSCRDFPKCKALLVPLWLFWGTSQTTYPGIQGLWKAGPCLPAQLLPVPTADTLGAPRPLHWLSLWPGKPLLFLSIIYE
jgi:hypothetical protein